MAHVPTPEDFFGSVDGPLLELSLKCNACRASAKYEFEYAVVSPDLANRENTKWDGILLSRIVTCAKCAATDDYALSTDSRMKLMGTVLRAAFDEGSPRSSRVMLGTSALWDGTVAHRPTQALEHLRTLIEDHPRKGEAWRRLGNAQERYRQLPEAEVSWRKALELDPTDLEAVYGLVMYLADTNRWQEALAFIVQGVKLLPGSKAMDPDRRAQYCRGLLAELRRIVTSSRESFALMAGWPQGDVRGTVTVNVSSVDLRKVDDWDALEDFLLRPDLISAQLTPELPEDDETILQRLLSGRQTSSPGNTVLVRSQQPVIRASPRQGRNEPCACGSGKKHKKCCGQSAS